MRDEEQIRLTLALYSRYNDYKDEEAWRLLYAPDAVVVARGGLQMANAKSRSGRCAGIRRRRPR